MAQSFYWALHCAEHTPPGGPGSGHGWVDGYTYPALVTTTPTPPAAVCPIDGADIVTADSLRLLSTNGISTPDPVIQGVMDASEAAMIIPVAPTDPAVLSSIEGEIYWNSVKKTLNAYQGARWRMASAVKQVITVGSEGADFTSIKAAVDSVSPAQLASPSGFVWNGNDLYIADANNNRVRKMDWVTKIMTTVAGTGAGGYSGDGGLATEAVLWSPNHVTVDPSGNLYISDTNNNVIRKVDAGTGIITTIAGDGTFGYGGDGGPATSAQFRAPGKTVIKSNKLYICDIVNYRVRMVNLLTGIITTVAGTGTQGYNGDGIPATTADIGYPQGITIDDSDNNPVFCDNSNHCIRKIDLGTGLISTIAGTPTSWGFSGDGGPATSAQLRDPNGVWIDSGDIYITDSTNSRIRKVDYYTGIIDTFLGDGSYALGGEDLPAVMTPTPNVSAAVFENGELYWIDRPFNRIRMLSGGVVTTIAGWEVAGYNGDNIPAIDPYRMGSTYSIQIAPGTYYEDPFILPAGVYLEGISDDATIAANDNSNPLITMKTYSSVKGCYIQGPTAAAGVWHGDTSPGITWFYSGGLVSGDIGLLNNPIYTTGAMIVTDTELYSDGVNTLGTAIKTANAGSTFCHGMDFGGPPTGYLTKGFDTDGPNAQLTLLSMDFDNNGAVCLYGNNGSLTVAQGVVVDGASIAVHIDGGGTGTTMSVGQMSVGSAAVSHIKVDSATGILGFRGGCDKTKILVVSGAQFSGNFTDIGTTQNVIVGENNLGFDISGVSGYVNMFPATTFMLENASTGIYGGGVVSRGAGTREVDVTGGTDWIGTGSQIKRITWTSATVVVASGATEYIYVDSTGTVQHGGSEPDQTLNVTVGFAKAGTSSIEILSAYSIGLIQHIPNMHDYLETTLGQISKTGAVLSVNGSTRKMDISDGTFYVGMDLRSFAGDTEIPFTYWYRSATPGEWVSVPSQTEINNLNYDDGDGTLGVMTLDYYRRDLLFILVNGDGPEYHVIYGQEEFADQATAEAGNNPLAPSFLSYTGMRVGAPIIKKSATTIAIIKDQRPKIGTVAASTGGAAIHDDLTGRDSLTAHTQYQLKTDKGQISGYASLDGSGDLPLGELPGHQATHKKAGAGGTDSIQVDFLGSSGVDPSTVLRPDGSGGVQWATLVSASGYSGYSGASGYSGYSGSGTSGYSGYSGKSGYSGYSGDLGKSGYSGYSGDSGYSGYSGSGESGYSGYSGSGTSGYSGYSGSGASGYSGYSGSGASGYSGYSGAGTSGYSGYSGSGSSGYSGYSGSGASGYSGYSGTSTSGYSGYSGSGISGYSGYSGSGVSGYSGYSGSGTSGYSGYSGAGQSGYSGYSGSGVSGYSGYSGSGASGYSGYSGSGVSGYSGYSGAGQSGYSGYSGTSTSGYSGYSGSGASGYSGYSGSGASGYSGYSGAGQSGYSGYSGSGISGYSGYSGSGISGYSGYSGSGTSGYSGYSGAGQSGYSGYSGGSGYSGYSGSGVSGYSGYSGSGASGYSGYSGAGQSGYSGYSGGSGYSGYSGRSGYSGYSGSGVSGYSGYSGAGTSGYSGYSGAGNSGYSGYSGGSGYSGYSGSGVSGYSGYSGTIGAFSRGGTVLAPAINSSVSIWRAPFACTILSAFAHGKGGGAISGANILIGSTSGYSGYSGNIAADDTWRAFNSGLWNSAVASGSDVEIMWGAFSGTVSEISIIINLSKP